MHFFQVYGVKNAPKFLLQKWTPNDLKKKIRGHIATPREPQSTPTQNCEMNINHKQRTPGWIFKMFTVQAQFFIRFPKVDHQFFFNLTQLNILEYKWYLATDKLTR